MRYCHKQNRDLARVLEPGFINDPRYEHELALLQTEFPGQNMPELLRELVRAQQKMAADTLLSKEKDNFRGVRIIPDYADVHLPASEDPFVKATFAETTALQNEVEELLRTVLVSQE